MFRVSSSSWKRALISCTKFPTVLQVEMAKEVEAKEVVGMAKEVAAEGVEDP